MERGSAGSNCMIGSVSHLVASNYKPEAANRIQNQIKQSLGTAVQKVLLISHLKIARQNAVKLKGDKWRCKISKAKRLESFGGPSCAPLSDGIYCLHTHAKM